MSTLARPTEASPAPARPQRRRRVVALTAVTVIVAAMGGFWLGRSTATPTTAPDPMLAYTASPTTDWTPAIYAHGPDATFAEASTVTVARDGQAVGRLASLTLVPGALIASDADPQALMRDAVLTYPTEVLPVSALDMSVIGSTLVACTHGFGIPDCAWFQDGTLKVFSGALNGGDPRPAERFLQAYLGDTRSIPTT